MENSHRVPYVKLSVNFDVATYLTRQNDFESIFSTSSDIWKLPTTFPLHAAPETRKTQRLYTYGLGNTILQGLIRSTRQNAAGKEIVAW